MRSARLHVRPLDVDLAVGEVVRRLAGRERVTAWSGEWSRGALVTCDPARVVRAGGDEVVALLRDQPTVEHEPGSAAVGGGWFGYLAYPGGVSSIGWYRDVLRHDGARWWYEALLDESFDERGAERRRADLVADLAMRPRVERARLELLRVPEPIGHLVAVERCQQEIRFGEIYQANVATRLELRLHGSPHDGWARLVEALDPARAGFVDDPECRMVGASPELFLHRRGAQVRTAPIKGTRPRTGGPRDEAERARLSASEKDAAENVMIVDLMRNDLGRVCSPGTVRVPQLLEVQPHPGVWHLVSTVTGRLAQGCDDTDLVEATFPPGSVTGAPKRRAMEVIADVEAAPRGLFTGAAGWASPVAGLELAVTIRTLEVGPDGRVELGVGGGITVDSAPEPEWEECLAKAAPLLRVLGAPFPEPVAAVPPTGLFETVLVVDEQALAIAKHVARLRRSYWECYGTALTADVAAAVRAVAAPGPGSQRVRVDVAPGHPASAVAVPCAEPVPVEEQAGVVLHRRDVEGGCRHKTADRARLAAAEWGLAAGECALLVGPGDRVWETTRSNVFVVSDGAVRTPVLDGNVLPGTARERVLDGLWAAGIPVSVGEVGLADLATADGAFVTNAVRGVRWVRAVAGVTAWAAPHPVVTAAAAAIVEPVSSWRPRPVAPLRP